MQRKLSVLMLSVLATVITAPLAVVQAASQTAVSQAQNQSNPFKTEELEQLVAPIAL